MTRQESFGLLHRVRDELDAGRFALSRALADLYRDADVYAAARANGVTGDELKRCARNLQVTFVLRLFAEFEAILRDFWAKGIGRTSEPDMRPLMESIARRRGMTDGDLTRANEIREYRNRIIHENLRDDRFGFPECLRALGLYLKWLPLKW
jgi:hypothetical protein